MTEQKRDMVHYEDDVWPLEQLPLERHFRQARQRPKFVGRKTNMYRGYSALWEIEDGRLWLVRLLDALPMVCPASGTTVETTLRRLFPESSGPIPATWFSGILEFQYGGLRCHFRGGIHDYTVRMKLDKGVVVSETKRSNARLIKRILEG